ncbi:hypothetical protein H9Q74_011003 [Fusarium xylarioides]|nr:hypothetical protein H9Q71_010506 [Fusarium xylarioides]KAG5816690.1 hypothetical protein H9Q74_011003 [Fusarium xylarioides]
MSVPPLNIAFVGLGDRALRHKLPDLFKICIGFDTEEGARKRFKLLRPHAECTDNLQKIIEWDDTEASRVDCAFVAVPHDKHFETVGPLLAGGIHVLKEKPASLSVVELRQLQEVAATYNVRLSTALQGRYSDRYHTLKEWLPLIGTIQCVEATRENYKPQLDQGWRSRGILGGGVHVDLGWHLLDLVLDLLPGPQTPVVRFSECLLTRPYQQYDAEDTYFASLLLPSSTPPTPDIPCYLKASRMSHHKTDKICIIGTDGTLVGEDCVVDLFASFESGRKRFTKTCAPPSVSINQMLLNFAQEVREVRPSSEYQRHSDLDLRVTHTSEKIRSSWEPKFKPQTAQDITQIANSGDPISAFDWPVITQNIRHEVLDQLGTTISIYGNDGVFAEFETEFKQSLGEGTWFALLHNSGSNALSGLYFACNLMPGDEVLFSVYGFHATVAPAMHFGIQPVFVDVDENGNMSSEALQRKITSRTKAVMLTHIWGIPCKMSEILSVLSKYPHVLLLEDCSHAHGASINGKCVGTFGDGAAWSLQGQKIISGGEGGIMVTKHQDFHFRALIWGHYNKRCRSEIPDNHPLAPYALTGTGLKHRAHPIAVRIALNQLRQLLSFQKAKSFNSRRQQEVLKKIPFLTLPEFDSNSEQRTCPAWYAFWIRFKSDLAPAGLTRTDFVRLLKSAGLDVDTPNSTRPLYKEPLFVHPEKVLSGIYASAPLTQPPSTSFPMADSFHRELIKMPVCGMSCQQATADFYVETLSEIATKYVEFSP